MTFKSEFKSHANDLGLLVPNRYEIYLSKEVMNIHFGLGAVKILEVKVRSRKKICRFGPGRGRFSVEPSRLGNFFSDLQL